MPRPKSVLNAFTANEVTAITRLSRPMVDYLAVHGFLTPAYVEGPPRRRGRVRYYSYRDLVIARIIQRLRETGVQLRRLKAAVRQLNEHPDWIDKPTDAAAKIRWLLSDGKEVFIRNQDGFLDDLANGQRAFAFVVNLDQVESEVLKKVPAKKRAHCSITNSSLLVSSK
jgi:DNA-binding transcriptional MerR regulator